MAQLATLWHWYQPPWQSDYGIERIAAECYRPVSSWLAENPSFPVAVNINASLVEHLQRLGLDDVLENLGRAAEQGSVEFVGSAAYHALLPALLKHPHGEDEVRRQIELNDACNSAVFGSLWKPRGFFPPEMAFSPDLALTVRRMGFEWAIADAVCYDAINNDTIPRSDIGLVNSLPVFFRSGWSNELSLARPGRGQYDAGSYIAGLAQGARSWFGNSFGYVAVGYDVETFGHHISQYDTSFLDSYLVACEDAGIVPVHFSTLLNTLPQRDVAILPGSWSTSLQDIGEGNYFPLWDNPSNPVHAALKNMTRIAICTVAEAEKSGSLPEARQLLDRGLHSCKEWWADRQGRWNPAIVLEGFSLLERAALLAGARGIAYEREWLERLLS